MAAIAEDEDLIAQAQERERLRLEEEARLFWLTFWRRPWSDEWFYEI